MRTYSELFALREFRALFLSRCLVMASISVSSLALGTIVFEQTGSAILSGLALFGGPLVTLVGSLTLLRLSDRLDGRGANLVAIGTTAVSALLQALPGLPWPLRFVILFGGHLVMSALGGSVNRLLRSIVPEGGFVLGRSTLNVAVGLMQVVGFAAAGLLMRRLSTTSLFLIAFALMMLAGAALLVGVRPRPVERAGGHVVRETHRFNSRLLGSPVIRPIMLAAWVPNGLVVGCESLFIPYGGKSLSSYLFAVSAAGMLVGDVVVGRVLAPAVRDRLIVPLRLLLALPYLVFFLHPPVPVVLIAGFVASIGYPASLPLQERLAGLVRPDVEGQAFGLFGNGQMVGQSVGAVIGGVLALWLHPATAMGVLAVLSTLSTLALARGLHRSSRPARPDRAA